MLTVRGLSRRFGDLVVFDNVSFDVAAGQIAVVVGPNGSGKTTLLRCVVGADRPDGGQVQIDGRRGRETDAPDSADRGPGPRLRPGKRERLQPVEDRLQLSDLGGLR
ncbi:MAG TPA: ATP-binding cassette domain-containing protein, partial [Jiangellales bacterium]|nr:ATP-binding cassette domain-containing protein [Jiangellales bacterium]